jgi:hypothetical protein
MRPALALACLLTACLLAGCGGNDKEGVARRADGSTLDALPTPERARGSVTGMPDTPGPGQPADSASASLDAIADADVGVDLDGDGEIDPIAPDDASTEDDDTGNPAGEPTSEDAVEALQQYYNALASRDFGSAYALWADGGRASGQTPDQFAAGFADTVQVVPTFDAPARVEGAVGSRFIEVPVAVETTTRDGRVRRFVGAYTLRRSVVDGATDEQRTWHIASADLRELTQ